MVTVPPCLWVVPAVLFGLEFAVVFPFDWHAVNMPKAMRTTIVFERLILTVPSLSVPMGSRAPRLLRPRWWRFDTPVLPGGRQFFDWVRCGAWKSRRAMVAGCDRLIQVASERDR
jgi:hypothetical protein